MSKFGYLAEGELNSNYLLELLQDYLNKLLGSNDTNGIVEDEYKIEPNSNRFVRWFKHTTKSIGLQFKNSALTENYNKVLTTKYVNSILNKIQIYLQTNVLTPKQFFDLTTTLKSIKFDGVIPLLEEYRYKAIKTSQKRFAKVLNDIKYLSKAQSNYVLYNSPVEEIKPFLTNKVSLHTIDYKELQVLVKRFIDIKYQELTTFGFEDYTPQFKIKLDEFYKYHITDNGVGEEVESFIRSKMYDKLEISKQVQMLPEDIQFKIDEIDLLLKRLKLSKIEQMIQSLIQLKYNLACVKEVIDKCKDIINNSTLPNKSHIFLAMDNLYYNLSKKCERLEQKTKLKLQLVDKQKMFNMLDMIQNPSNYVKGKKRFEDDTDEELETLPRATNKKKQLKSDQPKSGIAENLYDDDDIHEIHISEEDGADDRDDEVVIDDEVDN